MTNWPPAPDHVITELVHVRNMLVRLFAIPESEADDRLIARVARPFGTEWLFDELATSVFFHDGTFTIANRIYWRENYHLSWAEELWARPWPPASEPSGEPLPSGKVPLDVRTAVAAMMVKVFRLDYDEAESRIDQYLCSRDHFHGEKTATRNYSFHWAHDVYWSGPSASGYLGRLSEELMPRPWTGE